jgi:pimeloyl-ACP methyl ester carboxylesterase
MEVIDHCGHFPHLEKPAEFMRAVGPFLGLAG